MRGHVCLACADAGGGSIDMMDVESKHSNQVMLMVEGLGQIGSRSSAGLREGACMKGGPGSAQGLHA
ncbi:unnamed protein product [Urochloa humidicola]